MKLKTFNKNHIKEESKEFLATIQITEEFAKHGINQNDFKKAYTRYRIDRNWEKKSDETKWRSIYRKSIQEVSRKKPEFEPIIERFNSSKDIRGICKIVSILTREELRNEFGISSEVIRSETKKHFLLELENGEIDPWLILRGQTIEWKKNPRHAIAD